MGIAYTSRISIKSDKNISIGIQYKYLVHYFTLYLYTKYLGQIHLCLILKAEYRTIIVL